MPQHTVGSVLLSVVEGDTKRDEAHEGTVIAKRNRGLNSNFIVFEMSSGEGVERTFQTYSPRRASIEVKHKDDVRRAKLYYLRGFTGNAARIRETLAATEQRKVLPLEEETAEAQPDAK